MTTLEDNVDRFLVHPTYALAALLPDREHVDWMIEALSSGVESGVLVQVMHGQDGLRILDQRGTGHGLSGWFHRLLQNWTYYEQILGLYNEGLTGGEFLAVIPCGPDERRRIASAALSYGGHTLYYFGFDTVESVLGA